MRDTNMSLGVQEEGDVPVSAVVKNEEDVRRRRRAVRRRRRKIEEHKDGDGSLPLLVNNNSISYKVRDIEFVLLPHKALLHSYFVFCVDILMCMIDYLEFLLLIYYCCLFCITATVEGIP